MEEHKDILLFINKLMELGEKEGYSCASFFVKGKGRRRGIYLSIDFHKRKTVES